MTHRTFRLAAWSLLTGCVIATAGYLSAFIANGNGDQRFDGSSWVGLYTIALLGNVLIILGLPALVYAQQERSPRLTLIGYVGILVPLVILNLGEGVVEGFVKPYFAHHGGGPTGDLPGLDIYEAPALLVMLVGMICLAIAVFRARVLPWPVGVLFILTPVLGAAGLSGAISLLPDYCLFVALFTVATHVLRMPAPAEGLPLDHDPASSAARVTPAP